MLILALFCEGHLLRELPVRGLWRIGLWPEFLGSAGLILALLSSSRMEEMFTRTRLARLGQMSYSLYLLHGTVLFALVGIGALELPTSESFPLYLVLTAIATVVFYVVMDSRVIRSLATSPVAPPPVAPPPVAPRTSIGEVEDRQMERHLAQA